MSTGESAAALIRGVVTSSLPRMCLKRQESLISKVWLSFNASAELHSACSELDPGPLLVGVKGLEGIWFVLSRDCEPADHHKINSAAIHKTKLLSPDTLNRSQRDQN